MKLGLIWGYLKHGVILSEGDELYTVEGNTNGNVAGAYKVTSLKNKITMYVSSFGTALNMIYKNKPHKYGFICKVQEAKPYDDFRNFIIPAPLTGATSKDLPTYVDNLNELKKSYCWGEKDGSYYIISINPETYCLEAEVLGLSATLENRKGKYLNIVGVDGKVAIRNTNIRSKLNGVRSLPPFLDYKDVEDSMPVKKDEKPVEEKTDKAEELIEVVGEINNVEAKPLNKINAYTSKFIEKYQKNDIAAEVYHWGITSNVLYGDAYRRNTLAFYGQFGRYKSAVELVDCFFTNPVNRGTHKWSEAAFDTLIAGRYKTYNDRKKLVSDLLNINYGSFLLNYAGTFDIKYTYCESYLAEARKYIKADKYRYIGFNNIYQHNLSNLANDGDFSKIYNSFKSKRDLLETELRIGFNDICSTYNKNDIPTGLIENGVKQCINSIYAYRERWNNMKAIISYWLDDANPVDRMYILIKIYTTQTRDTAILHTKWYRDLENRVSVTARDLYVGDNFVYYLRKILLASSTPIFGVSALDNMSSREYNIFSCIKKLVACSNGEQDNNGVLEYLEYINENPLLALASLINDEAVKLFNSLIEGYISLNDFMKKNIGGTVDIKFYGVGSRPFFIDWKLSKAEWLEMMLNRNPQTIIANRVHNSFVTGYNDFTKELIMNYCCAIMKLVLEQENIKLSDKRLKEFITALSKVLGNVGGMRFVFATCIYLRYNYFNPEVMLTTNCKTSAGCCGANFKPYDVRNVIITRNDERGIFGKVSIKQALVLSNNTSVESLYAKFNVDELLKSDEVFCSGTLKSIIKRVLNRIRASIS